MSYRLSCLTWPYFYEYRVESVRVYPATHVLTQVVGVVKFVHNCSKDRRLPDIVVSAVVDIRTMKMTAMSDNLDNFTEKGVFVIHGINYTVRKLSWSYIEAILKKFEG